MKFLSKKSNSETLKALNEREIQERLYGKYHADFPKATNSNGPTNTATLFKPEIKSRLEPQFSSQPSSKNPAVSFNFFTLAVKWLKNFPWKFSGLVVGSLAGVIFVLQIFSTWVETLERKSVQAPTQKSVSMSIEAEPPAVKANLASVSDQNLRVGPLLTKTVQPVVEAKPTAPKVPDLPKKKYYVVQVCTYFQESDARELTQKLQNLNFSAFYHRMISGQGTPHYLVFLGKEETYSQARAQLENFKKTPEFKNFQDSFVRSVSF